MTDHPFSTPSRESDTVHGLVGSLSERILRRIFGERYEANANEDAEMAVAHLVQQRDSLAEALRHWDDAARESGLTYDAVRHIVSAMLEDRISFGRGIELLRSLARVAAEQMAKESNAEAQRSPASGDKLPPLVGPGGGS